MKARDFEKAIEALGVNGLEISKFSYDINGDVAAVYGKMGELTYLKWDHMGRGFSVSVEGELDGYGEMIIPEVKNPQYLDYRRDADFDLKFD